MKKILVLNYEFPPLGGGASPGSYSLAQRMSLTGNFDIDVVTMGFKNLPKYEEVNKNFRIYRVKNLRKKKEVCHPWEQATYLFSAWFKCKNLLKKNKYDLCYCHFIIPTGILAIRLKKKFNLPYIVMPHGSDVLYYNDRFKFIYPFLTNIWKKILDNSEKVILSSNFLKSQILKVYSTFNDKKIFKISYGIDSIKFVPQKKKKYIFSSGRLQRAKGFQYLIQAVSQEDLGYEVHIAGDGPMMSELKILAQKSKTKVFFHGWLDNKESEYRNLLEQSTIYVLASEKENFSVALMEAMSAGCAVITSNIAGCPEVIGDTGLLFNSGDILDLRRKITILINNNEQVERLQSLARERIVKNFDWNTVVNEYIDLL